MRQLLPIIKTMWNTVVFHHSFKNESSDSTKYQITDIHVVESHKQIPQLNAFARTHLLPELHAKLIEKSSWFYLILSPNTARCCGYASCARVDVGSLIRANTLPRNSRCIRRLG
uniref:Uncharacterized protein n=1 Tax=Odontella aurita TaxID=265563 RepID=A0A7S4NDJ7_9STRA